MKINLLYLKTGGGHLSTAKSIADELKSAYEGKVESVMIDGLDESPKFFKKLIEEGYHFSTHQVPALWPIIYGMSSIRPILELEMATFTLFVKKYIRKKILEERPDKIIILHHFLTKPVLQVLREENLKIPTLVVATDPFTPPLIWFMRKNSKFVVFSEKAKEFAIRKGIDEKNITIFPTIINKKYYQKIPAHEIRNLKEKHGFSRNKKLILLTGGGIGLPKGNIFLQELLRNGINAEIAVVCGKNSSFQKKCEKIKNLYPQVNIKIYGFIDFMYELMNMADIVITKGGPASTMESIMLERPPIIVSYIWRQEKGNVEFITRNKIGFYEPRPKKVVEIVRKLLEDKKALHQLKKNIRQINIIKNNGDLAKYIYDFIDIVNKQMLSSRIKYRLKNIYEHIASNR